MRPIDLQYRAGEAFPPLMRAIIELAAMGLAASKYPHLLTY